MDAHKPVIIGSTKPQGLTEAIRLALKGDGQWVSRRVRFQPLFLWDRTQKKVMRDEL